MTNLKAMNIEVPPVPSEPVAAIQTALPPALQPLLVLPHPLQALPDLLQVLACDVILELCPVTKATKLPATIKNQLIVPKVVSCGACGLFRFIYNLIPWLRSGLFNRPGVAGAVLQSPS